MRSTQLSDKRPWERPWWQYSAGNGPVLFYFVLVHVLAVVGLILFPLPSWPVLTIALILASLGGLGTSVCYHRCLAHRSLRLNPAVENVLIFFAIFNASGDPISWVANHRHHHAKADTAEDVSSPRHGGFWWAHLRWLWQAGNVPVLGGFIGATLKGITTTLGRGGSDTSAVAIAAAIHADRCDIYTDVDGVYTTDPRIVPKARKLDAITFEEMLGRVEGFELMGPPERLRSNFFNGIKRLPVRVTQ